jgi:aminoglycoside phosphotransferase (APT) family kinase protein
MVQGVNQDNVSAWLAAHIDGVSPPFEFTLIAGGHSNLTFLAKDSAGRALVLRRPPLGHVLESAHDMGREHRIISALGVTDLPVAPALAMCADASVNEAPFYVMEYVEGPVLHDRASAEALPETARQAIGFDVIDVLARLHAVDADAVGLGDLGRKEAYLARQLKRWNKQWAATKTHEIPAMEAVSTLLEERMPEQIGSAIVHGDYRLGNMIVGEDRLRAVLDWELCTLGDPLADVGYLLNSWILPGDPLADEADVPTAAGGFPSREALSARYAEATGRDLGGINYYRAFSHWRLAAIGQGVYKRYLVGAMGEDRDLDLEQYKMSVHTRAEAALALLEG